MRLRAALAKVFVSRADLWSARAIMIAFTAIGFGLLFQPDRFTKTPSYHNLLILISAQIWGVAYIAAGLALAVWIYAQPTKIAYGILAHTLPVMLSSFWLMAFVVRYFTDDATTIVNVVSWSVFTGILVHSASIAVVEGER